MIIDDFVSAGVPALLPESNIGAALDMMASQELSQLPVVAGHTYLALVREEDLDALPHTQKILPEGHPPTFKPAIATRSHPVQAWRLAMQHDLEIVPVVGQDDYYLGAVPRVALMQYISENAGLDQPGGIIVLSMLRSQYSLSALSQISESEDVSITSMGMSAPDDNGRIEVLLKTNSTDLSALIASLERHDYEILHVFGAESGQDDLMNRYQLLMNYINM